MGYVLAMGPCGACGRVMAFNPVAVPSFDFGRGLGREPICAACMETINAKRAAQGLPPHLIRPGAYDGCEEAELDG